MKTLPIVALFLVVALSGCTSGGGLSDYTAKTGDVSGFVYMELPNETKEQGFPKNPGALQMGEGGPIEASYASILALQNRSTEPAIISNAVRFNNATNAQMMSGGASMCSEDVFVAQKGAVMAMVIVALPSSDADYQYVHDQAHDAFHKILGRTDATDLCADGMEDDP